MFPRVSPRPRSERAVRTGGLPSHGAQPFPGRVWVRRVSLIPRNITRGKSGEYRAHRASPIPGVFVYPLRTQWRKTSARLRPAAPSRPRTARNAEGHCKQPPSPPPPRRCPPRSPRAQPALVGRAAPGAVPCAAADRSAGTIGAAGVAPTERTDVRGESRTVRRALQRRVFCPST